MGCRRRYTLAKAQHLSLRIDSGNFFAQNPLAR